MKKQTIEDFTNWFCREFNITENVLKSKSRKQELALKRHCFCAIASSQGFLQEEIANAIQRDRTVVSSSIKRHLEMVSDKKYRRIIGKKVLV